MKNTTPIWVLTGLAIVAAAGIAALTRDQWMGQPATPVATQEQAPAATAEKPAATPEATAEKPAEKPAEQQAATEQPAEKPAEQPQATAEQAAKPAEQPVAEQPAAEQPGEATPAAQPEAQPQPNVIDKAKVPAFDTVRVEKTGEAVIAGRAEAGSEITVKFGGEDIGKTTANEDGAFVLVPEKPLPAGSGALTIEAKGKGDLNPVTSEQSVAVIVPAGQQAEALVALVSPDQPTKVLQKPSAPAAEKPAEKPAETAAAEQPAAQPEAEQKPAKLVSIDAVDYDATGNIVFSGQGEAGNTARIYVDNKFVGDAAVGEDGRWTFAGTAEVSKGVHTLRVDGLDAKGNVVNRVEVPFFREEQTKVAEATPPAAPAAEQPAAEQPAAEQPAAEQPAAAQPEVKAETAPAAEKPAEQPAAQPEAPAAAAPEQPAAQQPAAEAPAAERKPAEQPAASTPPAETAAPAQPQETAQPQQPAQATQDSAAEAEASATPKDGRIVIQPGNNLWRISRVLYGSGTKYTLLYEANKDQIRNPNLIYPGQVFKTPDVAPKAESIDPARHEPLKPEENAAGAN